MVDGILQDIIVINELIMISSFVHFFPDTDVPS